MVPAIEINDGEKQDAADCEGDGSGIGAALCVLLVQPAAAQECRHRPPETRYILNTLSFLMHGFLVMWMAAGFAMLEAGLVRKRSVGTQLLKNIALFALAGIMFYLVGYNLMYAGVDGGWFGSFAVWAPDDSAATTPPWSRTAAPLRGRLGLVLPDGVRRDRGLDRLGRRSPSASGSGRSCCSPRS